MTARRENTALLNLIDHVDACHVCQRAKRSGGTHTMCLEGQRRIGRLRGIKAQHATQANGGRPRIRAVA